MKFSYVSQDGSKTKHQLYQFALNSDGSDSPYTSYSFGFVPQMFLHQADL